MNYDQAMKEVKRGLKISEILADAINVMDVNEFPELLPIVNYLLDTENGYRGDACELWDEALDSTIQ